MELRQIQYFIAIAEAEHFGRASKRVRIAQPALSRQVKLLETEIGAALFERHARGVTLTEAGRIFLAHARTIRSQMQRSIEEARAAAAGNSGTLRLGFIEVAGWQGMVPEGIRRFQAQFPRVKLSLSAMPTADQLAQLRQGLIDAALVYNPQPDDDLDITPLIRHSVVLAVPFDSAFASRRSVRLGELASCNFVGFQRRASPRYYDDLTAAFHRAGVSPHLVAEMTNETDMLALVSAGAGVALINSCQSWRPPRLVRFLPIEDLDVQLQLAMVTLQNARSAILHQFLASLREEAGAPT